MKTVRTHLLLAIVPLTLLPLLISTAMTVIMTYTAGSDAMGWGWTGQSSSALPELLQAGGREILARVELIAAQERSGDQVKPQDDELLVELDHSGIVKTTAGKAVSAEPLAELATVAMPETWDLVTVGGRIFFVAGRRHGEITHLLFRELDDRILATWHTITGAEVTLYANQKAVHSTWADNTGKQFLPTMSQTMQEGIASAAASADQILAKDSLPLQHYSRGDAASYRPTNTSEHEVYHTLTDVSDFEVYHTLCRLKTHSGQQIGFVGFGIPKGMTFDGVRNSIVGSTGLFLVLTVISLLCGAPVATIYAQPLSKVSNDIDQLLETISSLLPPAGHGGTAFLGRNQPRELTMLERSFERLSQALKAWKETEHQLAASRRQLIQAAKMSALGEMAGGVAHEINNPLTIVLSRSVHIRKVLMLDPPKLDKAVEFAKLIETTAERIAEIVRGLRTFSRSGESDPMERCELKSVLHDTLSLCAERFRASGVDVTIEGDWEGAYFEGRAVQISQVLLNLLGNSYDAVHELPEKWVKVRLDGDGTVRRVIVTDSGKGIPEAVRSRLMQPFFTTKPVGKGTGLGLSVSRGIMEEHHGSLTIDPSAANTTFVMTLPRASDPALPIAL